MITKMNKEKIRLDNDGQIIQREGVDSGEDYSA